MRIALAQMAAEKAAIALNLEKHLHFISQAIDEQVDLLVFPELSLSGYWPSMASSISEKDILEANMKMQEALIGSRLKVGIGQPYRSERGLHISMLILEDDTDPQIYSKQILHENEKAYFREGSKQVYIVVQGTRIAPAICYESMQPKHAREAVENGSRIYLSSVVKSVEGTKLAHEYFSELAKEHHITILFVNGVGSSEPFECAGQSAIWNKYGEKVACLSSHESGLLIYDSKD